MATSNATAASAAPQASQRSCWRSVPRARRKRPTSDTAPTTSATRTTTPAAGMATSSRPRGRAGTAERVPDGRVLRVQRCRVDDRRQQPDHGAAAATLAHQRQRGEGSDPVGVSSRTKPAQRQPDQDEAGVEPGQVAGGRQRPRPGHQPVAGVAEGRGHRGSATAPGRAAASPPGGGAGGRPGPPRPWPRSPPPPPGGCCWRTTRSARTRPGAAGGPARRLRPGRAGSAPTAPTPARPATSVAGPVGSKGSLASAQLFAASRDRHLHRQGSRVSVAGLRLGSVTETAGQAGREVSNHSRGAGGGHSNVGDRPPGGPAAVVDMACGRSQSDDRVGCMVWSITASSSVFRASRST